MNGCLVFAIVVIVLLAFGGGPLVWFLLPGLLPLLIVWLLWVGLRGAFADQARERTRASMGFPAPPPDERPRSASLPSGLQLALGLVTLLAGIGLIAWGISRL